MSTKARVQIVEPDPLLATAVKLKLEKLGYTVSGIASTKEEAVALARDGKPDLVLMDMQMGGAASGIAAADEVRKIRSTPVVFLAEASDEDALMRAGVAEPYGYILKPVVDRDLRTAVEGSLYRRRTELALHTVERWMASTLGSIGDGVISTDVNERVTYLNPVAEALTGWTNAEALGVELGVVLPLRNPAGDLMESPVTQVMRDGLIFDLALGTTFRRRDGREVSVEDSAAPIRGDEGEINGAVIIFRDCTEKVITELKLKSVESRLVQVQKMESLGRLASGVAHDFRNLMTIVSGYAEAIAADPLLSTEHRESVDAIRGASKSASDLTGQLLTFSRKQVLKPEATELNALIRGSTAMLSRLLGSRVKIDLQLGEPLENALVDPSQVSLILMNLVVNARDAMPHGGKIRITTAMNIPLPPSFQVSATGFVALQVSDEGEGMDEATLQRAFEPFFTTKAVGKGTGLGLSIVHGIVKQSGGYIDVASRPGAGTTFRIWFPQCVALPETSASIEAPAPGGRETLLVVDDNHAIRRLMRTILGKQGYSILVANDGEEAIHVFEAATSDIALVITDLLMPHMSGPQMAKQLTSRNSRVRFLYVSGSSEFAVSSNGDLPKGGAFLEKPFTSENLLKKVRATIDAA